MERWFLKRSLQLKYGTIFKKKLKSKKKKLKSQIQSKETLMKIRNIYKLFIKKSSTEVDIEIKDF